MHPRKIIITNRDALVAKYGCEQAGAIVAKMNELAIADSNVNGRALPSTVVAYTGVSRPLGGGDRRAMELQNLRAIQMAAEHDDAFYVLIVGGPDIVPHQTLDNPLRIHPQPAPGHDMDSEVPSDLPYACRPPRGRNGEQLPYGEGPADYIQPIRAVGRIPDRTGPTCPEPLIQALDTAFQFSKVPRFIDAFEKTAEELLFALGAEHLMGSNGGTARSISAVVGRSVPVLTARTPAPGHHPGTAATQPEGWGARLERPFHFIKCHGRKGASSFDDGTRTLLDTDDLAQSNLDGVVAVVECCYGADLFEPVPGNVPICNVYMQRGAYGYFGSTNFTWGGTECPWGADLVVRSFLNSVLAGAPLGVAALSAVRSAIAEAELSLEPVMLKTLAQFILLGDPSIQPCRGVQLFCESADQAERASASWSVWQVERDRIAAAAIARSTGVAEIHGDDAKSESNRLWAAELGREMNWLIEAQASFISRPPRHAPERPVRLPHDEVTTLTFYRSDPGAGAPDRLTLIRQRGGQEQTKKLVRQ